MCKLLPVTVLMSIAGLLNCSCPEHMLDYKNKCVSFNKETLDLVEAEAVCEKGGGKLAGTTFDIRLQLETNPQFRTLVPLPEKPTRYWADFTMSAEQIFFKYFFQLNVKSCKTPLLYDTGKWSFEWWCLTGFYDKLQSLCEFDKSEDEELSDNFKENQPRRRTSDLLVIQKQSTGRFLVGAPAFEKRVHSITFCTRTCEKAAKCDSVNFNPSTGACVGYSRATYLQFENTPGWEIWRFVVTSVDD